MCTVCHNCLIKSVRILLISISICKFFINNNWTELLEKYNFPFLQQINFFPRKSIYFFQLYLHLSWLPHKKKTTQNKQKKAENCPPHYTFYIPRKPNWTPNKKIKLCCRAIKGIKLLLRKKIPNPLNGVFFLLFKYKKYSRKKKCCLSNKNNSGKYLRERMWKWVLCYRSFFLLFLLTILCVYFYGVFTQRRLSSLGQWWKIGIMEEQIVEI